MAGSTTSPLTPTYIGQISTTYDALILFENCLNGTLNHVPRRPHDREREELIKSGNVFIYEEKSSGIKRWTDGVNWSPSRILGNFLIYRELGAVHGPGEKKKASKKIKKTNSNRISKPSISAPKLCNGSGLASVVAAAGLSPEQSPLTTSTDPNPNSGLDPGSREAELARERLFIGSLVDSYEFKDRGLIKKTISINYKGFPHHLVSYYTLEDGLINKFKTPSTDELLRDTSPREELLKQQGFRGPVEAWDENGMLTYPVELANHPFFSQSSIPMQHPFASEIMMAHHAPYPPHMAIQPQYQQMVGHYQANAHAHILAQHHNLYQQHQHQHQQQQQHHHLQPQLSLPLPQQQPQHNGHEIMEYHEDGRQGLGYFFYTGGQI